MSQARRRAALRRVDLLSGVIVADPRLVVPVATSLAGEHRLNFIAAEAAACALVHGAAIRMHERDHIPSLAAAASALGIDYQTVSPAA